MSKQIQQKNDHEIAKKIAKEKRIVTLMIEKYCKGNKHGETLCEDCRELKEYAEWRVDLCPFIETKTFCSNCKIHCYKPDMKEKIKKVMRYSGPRMLFSHPIITIDHVYQEKKHKWKQKRKRE